MQIDYEGGTTIMEMEIGTIIKTDSSKKDCLAGAVWVDLSRRVQLGYASQWSSDRGSSIIIGDEMYEDQTLVMSYEFFTPASGHMVFRKFEKRFPTQLVNVGNTDITVEIEENGDRYVIRPGKELILKGLKKA